jgi:AAA ATPase domain
VKGLADPVPVYELTGSSPARTRLQAALGRGLTRFVGRETEVKELDRGLAQAAMRHGQLISLVGEPGMGKSRLLYEFIHSHGTEDWLVIESGRFFLPQCQSSNLSLPLRDRWKIFVAMDRLLVATGEQEEGERYGGERYGDQRSEGGAKPVGCLRHHDLRLSALIGPTPAPDRGSCECGMRR